VKVAVAVGVVVILAGILGSTGVPRPSETPGSTGAPTGAASSVGPEASVEPWADLVVAPHALVAELTPDDVDSIGPAPGTTFTLRSLTATGAVELAKGLRIDPPVDFTVEPGSAADVAVVRPTTPLAAGMRYRFRLETPDGALAGTWAFVARSPLHAAGTLPADLSTGVPTNTGIEVTFDQDGTTGVRERFSITPAVTGRIEAHNRTWAFVPDQPLTPATIYTVTVTKGVGIDGSSEVLETDVTLRFETAVTTPAASAGIAFGKSIVEIRPGEEPAIGIDQSDEEEASALPTSVAVTIHRLPDFAAVEAAGLALAGPDSWAIASPSAVVQTAGLDLVAGVDAVVLGGDTAVLRIPVKLAQGHYVATVSQPGPAAQVLLQVTNLSAFAQTATDTTVVWVNDFALDAGLAGAKVAVVGGPALGTSAAGGILRVATPDALRVDTGLPWYDESFRAANLLAVTAADGRRLLVPLGLSTSWVYAEPMGWGDGDGRSRWWLLFQTDRSVYRQTDTINVFGTVRARSDRSVPDGIELRLRPQDGPLDSSIIRAPVQATERGVFSTDIRLDDLPRATYSLDLFVGEERVSSLWIDVQDIRKPAYQIDVATKRHAYLLGEIVRVSVAATFYDGTVVPGADLHVDAFDSPETATTDGLGTAAVDLRTSLGDDGTEGLHWAGIDVRPEHAEEGAITGSASILVAPSRVWIEGSGSVVDGRIVVDGKLSWVDLAALDAAWADGTDLESPAGPTVAGGTVQAAIVHLVPVKRQVGTLYDFIEKKVVPRYEYDVNEVSLGTRTLTSSSNGSIHLAMAVPVPEDGYQVVLTAKDPEGRPIKHTIYAAAPEPDTQYARPYLVVSYACGGSAAVVSGLNEPVTVTMHDADGSTADGRFLFLVSERGTVEATVQDAATFSRLLADADLPGFTVRAVWLSGTGYAMSEASAIVDPDDKAITIGLAPDRARYQPGDPVTIAITTTNAAGRPIAADVVIQGVDEKLYTLGLASDADPRSALLALPDAGFLQTYRSHAIPRTDEGGCGAEGGSRDDFRDTVTFQRIATDAHGRGSVTFDLSDDLTTWHMYAVAVSGALDAGHASVLIPVGLPFFVDATLAPEYLVGEQVVLRVRGFGAELAAGDRVRFSVSAPSLGLAPTTVDAAAFEAGRVTLPAMVAGDHLVTIAGETTVDGTVLRDSLVRTVHVIDTRLGTLASRYEALGPGFSSTGGEGLTRYVITDQGRGRFIAQLEELASATSVRFDRSAAAELARQLLIDEFHVPASSLAPTGFDSANYQAPGVALLPYATPDVFLSARAALVARSKINADSLREAFRDWIGDDTTREQRAAAYAGMAGLGDDVLANLREFDVASLTIREQLWIALGLAAAGDEAGARVIERAVLEAHGGRLGPWVRLSGEANADQSLEASGLLLLLASRLGDPLADDVARYLLDHPSPTQVFPLEQVGYVQAMLERVPRAAARFAWTIAGERTEVALEPGGAYTLVLTAGQRASLALEPIQGTLGVATTWTATNATLPSTNGVTVTRTISPAGSTADDRMVRVTLMVNVGSAPVSGCYRLTDLVPSGLALVASSGAWASGGESGMIWPYEVDGQRVSWCISAQDAGMPYGYSARVVSPGTYRWEPAVVQSERAPTVGASTPATTYTIR
jgi:hypothetical protein